MKKGAYSIATPLRGVDDSSLILDAHSETRSSAGALGHAWERLRASLAKRGWRTTFKGMTAALEDRLFDLRYGTDTAARVELDALDIPGDNKVHGVSYTPTHGRAFQRMIESLRLPHDSVLVDLGCGKGKVLLLACRNRFKRIVGVEFSGELCAVARRNLERFRERTTVATPVEIVEQDAADYAISSDENVFFLFNPFDAVVMARVMRNIRASLERRRRDVWIVYNNPVCRGVIQRAGGFVETGVSVHGSSRFGVYVNR
jgi:SAM-dependent methyltransferase